MITGKELAQKVLDHIEAHPERHDQHRWVDNPYDCGTSACLAGWTVLLNAQEGELPADTRVRLAHELSVDGNWESVAAKLLLGDEFEPEWLTRDVSEQQEALHEAFHTTYDHHVAIDRFADVFGLEVGE